MRTVINFNYDWEFALQRGFVTAQKEDAASLSYSPVRIPHDWAINSPFDRNMKQGASQGFHDRWGIGWYRKNFSVQKKAECVYMLCFGGIYEDSNVWVNDRFVGGRKYGYSSFELNVTDALKDGKNTILIQVDNTHVPACRWYSGAGIYRNIRFMELPADHLVKDNIRIRAKRNGDGSALFTVNPGTDQTVTVSAAGISQTGCGEIRLIIPNAKLWTAEKPNLYEVRIALAENKDEVSFRIGIRDVELSAEHGLFVNGSPVKLKGVCLHQDGGCFGTAVQPEIWRDRLLELKNIGCNSLRLAHHLYSEEFLDLTDELGFYVYEECLDKWTGGAYGRYYESEWEKDISCMVKRDRNRPSVLFWGVGNEVENQAHDGMLALLRKHVAKVKEYDSERPVSIALNPHFSYPEAAVDMSKVKDIQKYVDEMKTGEIFDVDDRIDRIRLIAPLVDLLCCNYQEQWYEKIHKAIPDKAILGTETYMYFRGMEDKFQNFTDRNPWFDAQKEEYVIGGMIWTGIDYLGESMGYPAKGWSGALYSEDMEKRPIAAVFQSFWTEKPMLHFAVMDYSLPDTGTKEHWDYPRYEFHWEFPQFSKVLIPYMIATNCEQVEITLKNESAGPGMEKSFLLAPTASFPNRTITGFLPYFPGTIVIVGKNGGEEAAREVIETPGPAVCLRFEKEEERVLLKSEAADFDGKEEIVPLQKLLKVRAFDREGRPVFRESAPVTFSVEGPAELIASENGDIKCSEPYADATVHLFHGKADAAILITGPGRIVVNAYAAGMFAARTVIASQNAN